MISYKGRNRRLSGESPLRLGSAAIDAGLLISADHGDEGVPVRRPQDLLVRDRKHGRAITSPLKMSAYSIGAHDVIQFTDSLTGSAPRNRLSDGIRHRAR